MIKPLASLFAKKAAEKKKAASSETEEKKTKPGQGDDDDDDESESDDDDESDDDTDDEQEDEQDDKKKKSASIGKQAGKGKKEAAMVSIKASEYEKLKADASAWSKNKAEFAVLQDWHKNAKGVGATNAKEDQNTNAGRRSGGNSVADKPWNKKAQERAERVK